MLCAAALHRIVNRDQVPLGCAASVGLVKVAGNHGSLDHWQLRDRYGDEVFGYRSVCCWSIGCWSVCCPRYSARVRVVGVEWSVVREFPIVLENLFFRGSYRSGTYGICRGSGGSACW